MESPYAWLRLLVALLLATIGCVGMWSVVVVLPAVQAEFKVDRAQASLAYTLVMVGFGVGGIAAGRLTDRFGTFRPVCAGILLLSFGYAAVAQANSMASFAALYGVMVGVGSSVMFGPLVADVSHWFNRRRGIAVALCASGNYFSGAAWPPLLQYLISTVGWRQTHLWICVICLVTMLPLSLLLRRRLPSQPSWTSAPHGGAAAPFLPLGLSPNLLQLLLIVAGVACCVAMAMPQVHIVAYCVDLGYGAARGAEMLSVMLACGVVSRLGFGLLMDRIGGLATLLLGSALQAVALTLFLPFDGLVSLYILSALFGLFQGGIVPSYAMIVRTYFPPQQAGTRVGVVLSATLAGMALGGWMSGAIFDLSGSYHAALVNGLLWNFLNMAIASWLMLRAWRWQHLH
ncbi:MFS transporter [Sabulicella rubraurantiaca]|uniref:MFS transporter n=1 Tax=Sabulicella rubraurantiaca TaxID=2811429 RepID=UPI002E2835AE|nr:MFS transporter [Sabulicella rubraurantiaca]